MAAFRHVFHHVLTNKIPGSHSVEQKARHIERHTPQWNKKLPQGAAADFLLCCLATLVSFLSNNIPDKGEWHVSSRSITSLRAELNVTSKYS
jgi:hypothetical protein